MSSLPRARRSTALQWSAAALTAAALYALPFTLIGALTEASWTAALAANLIVLVVVALRLWSPLVVLAAAVLSGLGAVAFFLVTAGDTCGDSHSADVIEWAGGVAVALAVGTLGVRRRGWALAAVPLGWILAGVWTLVVAHLVHGGTGGCFE